MKKEKATAPVRLFPSTRRRLKIKAAKVNKSLAEYIEAIEKYPLKEIVKV